MKSPNYSLVCATLIALTAISAPQVARAQEQPRPPQSAVNLDAKVELPAQFSATQFFDALAKTTGARVVVPVPDEKQLAQLNRNLGGQTLTTKEISPIYEKTLGYDLSNVAPGSSVIVVRLPDEMVYPRQTIGENYAAFLRLLMALSPAQIEPMNLQNGLTVEDLTPTQIPLYLDARQKNANVALVMREDTTPLTDAQILAQKVRFRFAFQVIAIFTPGDQVFGGLPLFDCATGLIWDPLVAADTKKFEKYFDEGTQVETPAAPAKVAVADLAKAINTRLSFAQTQTTTLGEMLGQIERASGQTIAFGEATNAERLRATPILVSAGDYKSGELTFAVAATAGLQFGFYNGAPTLTLRQLQQPISQLPLLVEQGQAKLRRLSLRGSGLPFAEDRFDSKEVKYEYLSGAEQFYLRAKLLNEQTEGFDQIELSKYNYRFENRLFFIGQTNDIDEPFVTSTVGLW